MRDDDAKEHLSAWRPPSPMDMARRELTKLALRDEKDAFQPPIPTEQEPGSDENAQRKEVVLFMQASELERLGKVSQAIKCYEQAFRLNPDVDRLVQGKGLQPMASPEKALKPVPTKPKFQPIVPGALGDIAANLDPLQEPPLGVPDEVLVRILQWVGLTHAASLEECARTCKAMYVASRRSLIWRSLYHSTWASLQRRCEEIRDRTNDHHHNNNPSKNDTNMASASTKTLVSGGSPLKYRELYFGMPRARTDGLYICRISYFRPGLTDGSFCQPIHLVTYYRYLRFFPATAHGHVVLFVVSTEEPRAMIDLLRHPPERELIDVIPQGARAMDLVGGRGKCSVKNEGRGRVVAAKPAAFRKANLFIGRYLRDSPMSASYSLILYDPQTTSTSATTSPKSVFALDLTVSRSSCSAVSNVIICDRYRSLSPPTTPLGPAKVYDFVVKDWGKFFFSRVRSYIS